MYMENKTIIFLLLVTLTGCDKHASCKVNDINEIYFEGFKKIKIDEISFEDLKDSTNHIDYINPKFETTVVGEKKLKINAPTSKLFNNGFLLKINNRFEYKVSDIKTEEISLEKKTMWGTIYGCTLKEYKLNDSLIESKGDIIIYKKN